MFILLSHTLSKKTPTYMNKGKIEIVPFKQIKKGNSSNSYILNFMNHVSTHVDCQKHFIDEGKGVSEYNIEDFIFEKVEIIKLRKEKGELILNSDLKIFKNKISEADFLIIKTNFQKYRRENLHIYQFKGPGFSSKAAEYLFNFKNLRGIGFDFISLSSPLHREEGRKAHKILLLKENFIIVEDMNLEKLPNKIRRLFVIPLFIEEIDSSPCTVIAEI